MTNNMPHDKTTWLRSRHVYNDDKEGNSRQIYGLYHNETIRDIPKSDQETQNNNQSCQEEQTEHHHKQQQWKYCLRHKFDAAL